MLADLRLRVTRDGEAGAEEEVERLIDIPLLIIDDLDRPLLGREPMRPLTMRESCAGYDLLRLSRILRDRNAAELPTVVTTRCPIARAAEQTLSISSIDLPRALLSIASGETDAIEDFPTYTEATIQGAIAGLVSDSSVIDLDDASPLRVAA